MVGSGPTFTWGSIVHLRENEMYTITVDSDFMFVADVLVLEDAGNHTPKEPPPDFEVKNGGGIALTEDGIYVVQ